MIRPLLCLALLPVLVSPAGAQEASLEKQARKLHAQAGGAWCEPLETAYDPDEAIKTYTFSYQPSWSSEAPSEDVTLIRIWCMAGAYNETHAYYMHTEFNGLMPVAFASPRHHADYENDDSLDGALIGLKVTGMNAGTLLVNSDFDPETRTISSFSKWRGIGDASSSGTWVFDDGEFTLMQYDIDASYDGEINPQTVINHFEN